MPFTARLCVIPALVVGLIFAALPLPSPAAADGKQAQARQSAAARDEKQRKADKEREDWLKHAGTSEVGKASWYGSNFHNRKTASGLLYDMHTFTAAHKTLPMGTVVRVTDKGSGRNVLVCVTDRGPYVRGRIIDLSHAAARKLGLDSRGVCNVELEVLSDETGKPLQDGQAYYIRYLAGITVEEVGPFHAFADAAAMHEALRQAHPEAEMVMDEVTERP